MLVVATYTNLAGDITGVTYNGVAMTSLGTYTYGLRGGQLWYLLNPASGANTVSISHTGAVFTIGVAASYTGVKQSGQPDAAINTQTTASGTSLTATVTVTATGSWLVTGTITEGNALTAGTGATLRITGSNVAVALFDSNGSPGTGSQSMTINESPANQFAIGMVSFAPAAASGPANVKTFDGVTQSTGVKTYMGNALTDTKTVMGVA